MDDSKFQEITSTVVARIGNRLCERHPELEWRPGWESRLRTNYETARECIINDMHHDPVILNHRIDRHKVAAAFTKAILQSEPLRIKHDVVIRSAGARLANEALSFLVAVSIVRKFLMRRFRTEPEWTEKIGNTNTIFPPANEETYSEHIYKAFYNSGPSSLNLFFLANLYFMVESYFLRSLGWDKVVPNFEEEVNEVSM